MDKTVKETVGKFMEKGEKMAPVKSIKLKVKFRKESVEKAKKSHSVPH